ncbi:hypothetical protein C8R45DRAFT_937241 [Mycena sanguinolenta]|nr:hypothetical protein C8R45DRAFT_937241 [Mycena sanguinolenta]
MLRSRVPDYTAWMQGAPELITGLEQLHIQHIRPDTLFAFDFATVLPFSDGFSDASFELGSLFVHESDSTNWNSSWSSSRENFWELENEFTSSASSFGSFSIFLPELERFLAVADSSLENVPAAADSLPVHLWASEHLPVSSSDSFPVGLKYEMSDVQAQRFLGWEWKKSSTGWLDGGVSSEVCYFPQAIKVLDRTKIFHVKRVTGLPSRFRVPREVSGFPIDITHVPNLDPDTTVDALLKDQDVHPWGDPLDVVPKSMPVTWICFGCAYPKARIACRRSKPKCCGAYSCESLASEFIDVEQCEFDPNSRDRLVEAQLRTRETQDSSRTGQVLSYIQIYFRNKRN